MTRSRATRAVPTGVLVTAVVLAALLMGCTAQAGSAGPPTQGSAAPAPPSPAPLTQTFTSAVNGYTMSYPATWTVVAASQPWRHGREDADASTDKLQSPQARAVYVTSQALPAGWTEDRWVKDYLKVNTGAEMPQCFPARDEWIPVEVDGHSGGLLGGDYGCSFTRAIVFAGKRAYIFNAMPDPAHINTDIFDQGLFNQMLASVHLTPQTAA